MYLGYRYYFVDRYDEPYVLSFQLKLKVNQHNKSAIKATVGLKNEEIQ